MNEDVFIPNMGRLLTNINSSWIQIPVENAVIFLVFLFHLEIEYLVLYPIQILLLSRGLTPADSIVKKEYC